MHPVFLTFYSNEEYFSENIDDSVSIIEPIINYLSHINI